MIFYWLKVARAAQALALSADITSVSAVGC
jgi:hypothetical protein